VTTGIQLATFQLSFLSWPITSPPGSERRTQPHAGMTSHCLNAQVVPWSSLCFLSLPNYSLWTVAMGVHVKCSEKGDSPEFTLVLLRGNGSPQPLTTSDLSGESDTRDREPGYCCHEMDPLSITAGVAGILTLAVSIGQGGHDVFHSLKDFRKELTSFTGEIEFISRWLDTLPTRSQSSIVSEAGDLQVSRYF